MRPRNPQGNDRISNHPFSGASCFVLGGGICCFDMASFEGLQNLSFWEGQTLHHPNMSTLKNTGWKMSVNFEKASLTGKEKTIPVGCQNDPLFQPLFSKSESKGLGTSKTKIFNSKHVIQEMARSVNQKHITTAPVGSQAKDIAVSVPHTSGKMANVPESERDKKQQYIQYYFEIAKKAVQ